jgi:shikimate kinase
MNIFLIGFMGSGKSYIGKRLAARLGWHFLDADHVLEQKVKTTIGTLFQQHGEAHFRALEADTLRELPMMERLIVATGGGAPCFHDNINWMKANGIVVYLKAETPVLVERLQPELTHRPILAGKDENSLHEFIHTKISERAAFYEQAHIVCEQKTGKEDLVSELATAMQRLVGEKI